MVARVSTYLAGCNINIEDIEQRVMEGLFIMTMRVDLTDLSLSLDEMVLGLKRIGDETHMDVSVRLHGARERKRVGRAGQQGAALPASSSSPTAPPAC